MNAKVHDTIGVSPAELLFGQAINLNSGLLSAIPPESLIKGLDDFASGRLSEHVAKLAKAQHTLIEVATNNQLASDSHHMREACVLQALIHACSTPRSIDIQNT
jgi:hypothetical protein